MHFIKIVFIILFLTNININAQETLPFEIEADNIKVENKTNNLFTSGNVIIKYKTYIINSDEAIYYKNNNQLLFNGNISISDKQSFTQRI